MRCFYHLESGEIKAIPKMDDYFEIDDELWVKEIQEIEENATAYYEFTATVNDLHLQNQLMTALNKRKPFQNFKYLIDNSGDYRQKWFDFRQIQYVKHIQKQLFP